MTQKSFHSNGKLLITGEYLVLDGALALALPTQKGQSLQVEPSSERGIYWKSLDKDKNCWFEAKISLNTLKNPELDTDLNNLKTRLIQILLAAKTLNPSFLTENQVFFDNNQGIKVTTALDFPRDWGLGSSSTLINNIARWAQVDAFQLSDKTFGGSGYDVACAQQDSPILYRLNRQKPVINPVKFNPAFADQIFFVHLNQKQNTRDAVKKYRDQPLPKLQEKVEEISKLTENILKAENLETFEDLVTQHEDLLSSLLHIPPVKKRLFPDFKGSIKSLGGWGGDFIMATGTLDKMHYFQQKGFFTIIPYKQMILS